MIQNSIKKIASDLLKNEDPEGKEKEEEIEIVHQSFGHRNITFKATRLKNSVIIRTNTNSKAFDSTIHNLNVLRSLNLPVPKVISHDFSMTIYPFAFMVTDCFQGRDLRFELEKISGKQIEKLANQLVDFQKKVIANIPLGNGFGYVGIGEKGTHSSWYDLCKQNFEISSENKKIQEIHHRIHRLFEYHKEYFCSIKPLCFMDDITIKNVIIFQGELQGLIDFDSLCYGDPLIWISLTETAIRSDIQDLSREKSLFYVRELKKLWKLSKLEQAICFLYSSNFSLEFIKEVGGKEECYSEKWEISMIGHAEEMLRSAETLSLPSNNS
jgi:aminoglycoside phosphotransferase (APT) family kinase protein